MDIFIPARSQGRNRSFVCQDLNAWWPAPKLSVQKKEILGCPCGAMLVGWGDLVVVS